MNDLYAKAWGGNPNLKPEEGFSYEVGLDQKITQNSAISLSVYRNETDEDLQKRPRQKATLSAGLQNEVYGISASVVGSSKSKSYSAQYDNSGYATIDVNAYWNINPNIKLFTNIENIGDVQYETEYSSGNGIYYINGGRQASVGVTFKY